MGPMLKVEVRETFFGPFDNIKKLSDNMHQGDFFAFSEGDDATSIYKIKMDASSFFIYFYF